MIALFLQTDASDYGIGAHCFQLVDNVEQPVAFVSKSLLTATQWAEYTKRSTLLFTPLGN
jgi:hypothetical protein